MPNNKYIINKKMKQITKIIIHAIGIILYQRITWVYGW